MASLSLTFVGLCWLFVNAAAVSRWPDLTGWLVLPLALLSLNLLAAIITNRVFRSQAALLTFHIGLLCVLVLAGAGIMLRFEGNVEIVEGAEFDPRLVNERRRGWLHSGELNDIGFVQGPIEVRYWEGLQRDTTSTSVEMKGRGRVGFGDRYGVTIHDYRFLTTSNKGYAVLLMWEDADGRQSLGAVNFPSYPDLEWKQVNDWTTPAGQVLNLELVLPDRAPKHEAWVLASDDMRYRLRVSDDSGVAAIVGQGDIFDVDGGRVRVTDLRLWMGYRVDYNPVLPWLVAAAFLSLAALAVHVQQKFKAPARSRARTIVGQGQEA
jgi:cytochrome c biogenesis protein